MGNQQSIADVGMIKADTGRTFVPPYSTLSSLKASTKKEYSFNLPKQKCTTEQTNVIAGDLGERKFVTVDRTRCLLVHKEKTEAILLLNNETQTIHICSFTPPGNNQGGVSLFEWGHIQKLNGLRRGFKMTTPYDGSYFVQCPMESTKHGSNRMMIVRSFKKTNHTCATLEETESSWKCRIMCGVDPAMLLCFVVAVDVLRNLQDRKVSTAGFGSIEREAKKESRWMSWSTSSSKKKDSIESSSSRPKPASVSLPSFTSFINIETA